MFYFPKNNVFGGPLLFSLQLRSLESLAVLETSKSEIPEAKVSTVIYIIVSQLRCGSQTDAKF